MSFSWVFFSTSSQYTHRKCHNTIYNLLQPCFFFYISYFTFLIQRDNLIDNFRTQNQLIRIRKYNSVKEEAFIFILIKFFAIEKWSKFSRFISCRYLNSFVIPSQISADELFNRTLGESYGTIAKIIGKPISPRKTPYRHAGENSFRARFANS